MQDLENNIDELFRKAADGYRIDSGKSDWDNILPQLGEPGIDLNIEKTTTKKYHRLSVLLAFFFLSATIFTIVTTNKNLTTLLKKSTKTYSAKSFHESKSEKKSRSNYPAETKNEVINGKQNIPSSTHLGFNNAAYQLREKIIMVPKDEETFPGPLGYPLSKNENDNNNVGEIIIDQTTSNDSSLDEKTKEKNLIHAVVSKNKPLIYAGLIGGPTFNQVKNQGMNKPGFDIGLRIGYTISNKASVEAGLSLNKKYYNTEAKYFSMDKISSAMPQQMKVLSIEGNSTVIEVPLSLKYDLFNKNKTAVFSSLGLSSYFLINEKNNYHTMMNGTQENITGSYKNSSRYLAAAVNISVGVENSIGSNNKKIRIEPYVQIPLKGIGVGTLPVMSAGLHVGYTLPLH